VASKDIKTAAFQREIAELRLETERQLNALTSALKALEAHVAELSAAVARSAVAPVAASAPSAHVSASAPAATPVVSKKDEEIAPEMMLVIAAAVTAYLGKKVRIRSAKMLQSPYEIVNPWSQQGRVFVQASHNLRSRG
jgi:predicted GNAT superfamily acetyltransferase